MWANGFCLPQRHGDTESGRNILPPMDTDLHRWGGNVFCDWDDKPNDFKSSGSKIVVRIIYIPYHTYLDCQIDFSGYLKSFGLYHFLKRIAPK